MKPLRGETTAIGTLILFLLFLFILGGVWLYTGGPEQSQGDGAFLNPSWPFGGGGTYEQIPGFTQGGFSQDGEGGGDGSQGTQAREPQQFTFLDLFYGFRGNSPIKDSPYAGLVTLEIGGAGNSDPKQEYIVLRTSYNLERSITLSGWSLQEDASNTKVTIGQAAQIPFLGQINVDSPITLPANSVVYITTGRSPNGASFRVNQCTGYFEQFQDFNPQLSLECPYPEDEILRNPSAGGGDGACLSYIQNAPRCILAVNALPRDIQSSCQTFIVNELSYNGCINAHKNEPNFYRNEWRVFLNRDQEVWRNQNERIRLLDENGKVIDVIGY